MGTPNPVRAVKIEEVGKNVSGGTYKTYESRKSSLYFFYSPLVSARGVSLNVRSSRPRQVRSDAKWLCLQKLHGYGS